ncbi:MAG TPA: 2-phospho-L-lactate guanylyltransferase [Dehalococcoidia bacterium]|nr:2-phospho-L-lactate guanylyltransferase [Dehalococcoidia bacterium]
MDGSPVIDALLPFKRFDQAKGRLSELLTPPEREALARLLLTDALKALTTATAVRYVYLISSDADAAGLAGSLGARSLAEPSGTRGLNDALEAARRELLARPEPPAGLLVLHADIAGIDARAIDAFSAGAGDGPLVRLCPARDDGTNALLLLPPAAIPFHYGRNSATAHEAAAREAGVPGERRVVSFLQDDLDTPADIERLLASGRGGAVRELLLSFGHGERLSRGGRSGGG